MDTIIISIERRDPSSQHTYGAQVSVDKAEALATSQDLGAYLARVVEILTHQLDREQKLERAKKVPLS